MAEEARGAADIYSRSWSDGFAHWERLGRPMLDPELIREFVTYGIDRGVREGIRQAREAVESVPRPRSGGRHAALAAIDALVGD